MAQSQQLLRKITMPMLLFYGLGNILGAGIYVLIAEVANTSGMYAPFSFLVALIIVSFTALSYGELASRYPDAAGVALYVKKGWLPSPLSYINSKTKTPVVSTLFVSMLTLGFALWLPLVTLANLTSFLVLIVFTVLNMALIRIKLHHPDPEGTYLIPIWIPVSGVAVNLIFLLLQLFSI